MIPRSARNCAFCSARQQVTQLDTATLGIITREAMPPDTEKMAPVAGPSSVEDPPVSIKVAPAALAATIPLAERVTAERPAAPSEVPSPPVAATSQPKGDASSPGHAHSSRTGNTLFGVEVDAGALVAAAREAEARAAEVEKQPPVGENRAPEALGGSSPATASTPALPEPAAEPVGDLPFEEEEHPPATVVSWAIVSRSVMALAGIVLFALYVSSHRLMVAFARPQLVLEQYFLVAAAVLFAASLMRLPTRFRAGLAVAIGAVPLFLVGPSVGGFDGWRGLGAALVFLLLPGALFLRARSTDSTLARVLIGISIALVGLLYPFPDDGVVPVAAAVSLLSSGSVAGALTGGIFLSPLVLALLALTAFASPESTGLGALWACLVLLLAPGAIIVAGFADDDAALVHVGVALLATGATVAVGLAQLLDPAPQTA